MWHWASNSLLTKPQHQHDDSGIGLLMRRFFSTRFDGPDARCGHGGAAGGGYRRLLPVLAEPLPLRQHAASETYVALGPDNSITRPTLAQREPRAGGSLLLFI
jgi:hypothetical protein